MSDDNPTSTASDPTSTPAPAIPQESWDRAVADWINEHIRNSPVAQASGAWSHLMTAIHELKPKLEAEIAAVINRAKD